MFVPSLESTTRIAPRSAHSSSGASLDFLSSRIVDQHCIASEARSQPTRHIQQPVFIKEATPARVSFQLRRDGVDVCLVLKIRENILSNIKEPRDRMRLSRVCALLLSCLVAVGHVTSAPSPQEPIFELPVQLVGFPVIIAAVRITNFIKKLAYSLSPQTYANNRVRRSLGSENRDDEVMDIAQVEKRLIAELGENVCIYERICSKYAGITLRRGGRQAVLDWDIIFSQYKASPNRMKENYLLSVFLGDIVGSPRLCHQLAKRGRACDESTLAD